jgi:hypothetical protein
MAGAFGFAITALDHRQVNQHTAPPPPGDRYWHSCFGVLSAAEGDFAELTLALFDAGGGGGPGPDATAPPLLHAFTIPAGSFDVATNTRPRFQGRASVFRLRVGGGTLAEGSCPAVNWSGSLTLDCANRDAWIEALGKVARCVFKSG